MTNPRSCQSLDNIRDQMIAILLNTNRSLSSLVAQTELYRVLFLLVLALGISQKFSLPKKGPSNNANKL